MIQQQLRCGRRPSVKILEAWHKAILKPGRKGQILFVMTHKEIDIAKAAGHKWTYARVVVDHRPQKEDPNRIRIAVGGNLITYQGSTSTRTVDLTTSKLLWNSVLSTKDAKYMCIDIKNFYLTAALDYYENPTGTIPRVDQNTI